MKIHLITLLIGVFCVFSLAAQEPALGNFGFINAVDSESRTFLKVNGQDYKVNGYPRGGLTIYGKLHEGVTSFAVENADIKGRAQVEATINANNSIIIMAYVERTIDEKGETKEKMVLKKMNSNQSSEYKWSGLYLSNEKEPITIKIGASLIVLAPLKLVSLPVKANLDASIVGQETESIQVTPDRPGHYLLIVYDKKGGGKRFTMFPDDPASE